MRSRQPWNYDSAGGNRVSDDGRDDYWRGACSERVRGTCLQEKRGTRAKDGPPRVSSPEGQGDQHASTASPPAPLVPKLLGELSGPIGWSLPHRRKRKGPVRRWGGPCCHGLPNSVSFLTGPPTPADPPSGASARRGCAFDGGLDAPQSQRRNPLPPETFGDRGEKFYAWCEARRGETRLGAAPRRSLSQRRPGCTVPPVSARPTTSRRALWTHWLGAPTPSYRNRSRAALGGEHLSRAS